MDQELKSLLTALLTRIETIESRLQKLEAVAHKQITDEDLLERYKKCVLPVLPVDAWPPRQLPDPYTPGIQVDLTKSSPLCFGLPDPLLVQTIC